MQKKTWKDNYLVAQWNGWWALKGFAIADEWFDVQFPDQPSAMGRGINIRMWNEENSRWSNMWMHTGASITTELHSKMTDGKMVMYQVAPEDVQNRHIEFEVYADGNWSRFTYTKDDAGNLTPQLRLDAIKQSCNE